MTAIITTTLYPSSSDFATSSFSQNPSSSNVATTITHLVTKTLASDTTTSVALQDITFGGKSASATTIGLSIGLPVGIFCLGLAIFLCYFYLKRGGGGKPRTLLCSQAPSSHDKAWLPDILYGSNSYDSYSKEKQLPFVDPMSSKIQYKISKPIPQHILTPKAPIYGNPKMATSTNVKDDVDTFLYSRPPNIYHIDSKIPSSNNLSQFGDHSLVMPQVMPSSPSAQKMTTSFDEPLKKWTYQSPLSRWFLRSSTYLQDGLTLPASIKTPTVQLKQLKILSRINKGCADSSQFIDDEKSPILENVEYSGKDNRGTESASSVDDAFAPKSPPGLNDTIGTQIFEIKNGQSRKDRIVKLDPIPPRKSERKMKRKERRQSRLKKHLKQVSDLKPLPLTPTAKENTDDGLHPGLVYRVIHEYNARLTDEIHIIPGEYVKILATHTDGWSLVEKCSKDGISKSQIDFGGEDDKTDINDKGYLNDDRGIVPGDCLNYR